MVPISNKKPRRNVEIKFINDVSVSLKLQIKNTNLITNESNTKRVMNVFNNENLLGKNFVNMFLISDVKLGKDIF